MRVSYLYYFIILVIIIAVPVSFWHFNVVRNQITEIWEETLWEDCNIRMSETGMKKIKTFAPSSTHSDNMEIVTEDKTIHIKKEKIESLTPQEKDFLTDQHVLSLVNPIKIEKLDSLLQVKLRAKGLAYQTAIAFYDNTKKTKTLYGQTDINLLHDYLKLNYNIDIRDRYSIEGYIKGGWLENLFWHKDVYIFLSSICIVVICVLFIKRYPTCFYSKPVEQREESMAKEEIQILPESNEKFPSPIFWNKEKHTIMYNDKELLLAPKVFNLFYLLIQGENNFQTYEFLIKELWSDAESADKKHLEQLVIRLRKDLQETPLTIETIRGSGYQIKGINDEPISIKQTECNEEL